MNKYPCSHRLRNVWDDMIRRCHDVNNKQYKDYGARGIIVCDEWKYSYLAFYAWAIKHWKPTLQIDRKNNDDGYYPDNCQFITSMQNNQSSKKRLSLTSNTGFNNICLAKGLFVVTISIMGKKMRGSKKTLEEAKELLKQFKSI